ncbi:MAG TPA: hypothetical protein VFX58_00175 [Chitinophagaceae bacterium]|nr:hypothetical protein [Chitinophagaceae bacterium]
MKKIYIAASLVLLFSCTKQKTDYPAAADLLTDSREASKGGPPKTTRYTTYTIQAGQHYCDQNTIKSVRTSEMKFMTKFDNSAIYQTVDPGNQYDINKLWGFSEGFNHQYNSARIGWSWNDGALRLYAYAYVNGVRHSQEISTVGIGTDISCSIKITGNSYIFTVNGASVTLPRALSTSQASGYQLYPYFGGDETAPHLITILLRNL